LRCLFISSSIFRSTIGQDNSKNLYILNNWFQSFITERQSVFEDNALKIYIFVLRVTIRTEKEVQWGKGGSAIHTHALPSKWLMHSSNVGQRTTRSTRHGVGLPARAPLIFYLLSSPGSYSCFQVYICVCVVCICIYDI